MPDIRNANFDRLEWQIEAAASLTRSLMNQLGDAVLSDLLGYIQAGQRSPDAYNAVYEEIQRRKVVSDPWVTGDHPDDVALVKELIHGTNPEG